MAARDELIHLESIDKVYGTGDGAVAALREFSLTVETGESLAVMGPSGSGNVGAILVRGPGRQPPE